MLTQRETEEVIILHLEEMQHIGNSFQRPYEVTVSGMKECSEASATMTARTIVKLRNLGLIDYEIAHPIKDGTVQKHTVRCYRLTASGLNAARRFRELSMPHITDIQDTTGGVAL